jgi:hypothetical protein
VRTEVRVQVRLPFEGDRGAVVQMTDQLVASVLEAGARVVFASVLVKQFQANLRIKYKH